MTDKAHRFNPDTACRSVRCPSCHAERGEHCHQTDDHKRKPVRLTHLARRRLWEAQQFSGVQF